MPCVDATDEPVLREKTGFADMLRNDVINDGRMRSFRRTKCQAIPEPCYTVVQSRLYADMVLCDSVSTYIYEDLKRSSNPLSNHKLLSITL